jgi:hypothetical protein
VAHQVQVIAYTAAKALKDGWLLQRLQLLRKADDAAAKHRTRRLPASDTDRFDSLRDALDCATDAVDIGRIFILVRGDDASMAQRAFSSSDFGTRLVALACMPRDAQSEHARVIRDQLRVLSSSAVVNGRVIGDQPRWPDAAHAQEGFASSAQVCRIRSREIVDLAPGIRWHCGERASLLVQEILADVNALASFYEAARAAPVGQSGMTGSFPPSRITIWSAPNGEPARQLASRMDGMQLRSVERLEAICGGSGS